MAYIFLNCLPNHTNSLFTSQLSRCVIFISIHIEVIYKSGENPHCVQLTDDIKRILIPPKLWIYSWKISGRNMESVNLFESSQFREKIAQIILQEMKELLNVSFTSEEYFPNSEPSVPKIKEANSDDKERKFEIALSTLAEFHAASEAYINSELKKHNLHEIEILRVNPFCEKKIMNICSLVLKYFKEIKEIYPHTFLDVMSLQEIEGELNIISKKLIKFDECKKVLINGRYSHDNLIFNENNTACKIKDFSYVAYQSPLFDVFHYVGSCSSVTNWKANLEKAKILYYDFLHHEMKKFNIDINKAFPSKAYEETFELILPIMKIIFYLKPQSKRTYLKLAEILNVLNLKTNEASQSTIAFEDCYKVCKNLKMGKFYLNSFDTTPQAGRNGFLGEHHDMIIGIENQGIRTIRKLFLKSVPRSEALKEFANTVGSFFKETMFYSRYIPLLKEHNICVLEGVVPECYFADESKYIVLDNLKSYGYTTLSPRLEMSNDIILRVIEILAKFNASCIILEELIERKTGCKFRLPDIFERELKEAFFSTEPVIESHRNSGTGGMAALTEIINFDNGSDQFMFKISAEEACNEQVYLAKPSKKWRNTICHGDFWTKNFMIKIEGNTVKNIMMIDFQTYRYAPPAQDLMAFIYLNTTRELRQKCMHNWLSSYYKVFSRNLQMYSIDVKNILPVEEFNESCKFYEQFAITQSITHFQIILVPPTIIDPILEDQTRAREIFLGSRYNLVKMVWPMDELYRKRLTESVEDLRRCLMEKKK